MQFGPVPLAEAEGAILAHSVPLPEGGRLRKGIVLDGAALARLSPQAFDQWVQLEGREHLPMDRRGIVFAGGHLAGSVNVGLDGRSGSYTHLALPTNFLHSRRCGGVENKKNSS